MAQVQWRQRRSDICWSTLGIGAGRHAHRRCRLDNCVLADPVCFIGFSHGCACSADRHSDCWLARTRGSQTARLCFGVRRGNCRVAPSVESLPAASRHGAAFYSKMRIVRMAVVGAGGWGTALARLWAKDGRKIVLWGHNVDRVARMQKNRENSDYLPGLQLPASVHLTSDVGDCAEADLIVLATPSTALRNIAAHLAKVIGVTDAVLLSCTKGIEHGSGMRMTEILRETFPANKIAVLSGPNLATEVAKDLPTATVIACEDGECAARLQAALGSPRFRIYTSRDVVSIELGGAMKNVFAIAAGISDGLGLGDNAKAALVIRSLAELVRFGVAMGGTANALYGLSGAGDLILTCYSESSRNHTVGNRLGRGEALAEITASMKMVAEGIPTARSAWECARRLNIATPITDQVYSILYKQKKPAVALEELLKREPKPEQA